MNKNYLNFLFVLMFATFSYTCNNSQNVKKNENISESQRKLNQYVTVKLTSDINSLSESEKQMLPLLFEAANIVDRIFSYEVLGNADSLCQKFPDDATKNLYAINYGPWDRLNGNKPFMDCLGNKPLGANFYPLDMTREEFEKFKSPDKLSPYTFIRRKDDKSLETIPYHVALEELVKRASDLLHQAAQVAENEDFKKYLDLRATAFLTDDYFSSDTTWLNLKNNNIDFIAGPVDIYEDQLFSLKAEHQAYILIKDKEWSNRLKKYTLMLRFLQKALPVPEQYRQEEPGEHSEISVYDIIYYGGSGKAGGAMMSANFPFDSRVQLLKGTKNLQFKNTIKAKFENIILPIADLVIDKSQRKNVYSDAYFANILFFDMANCLGIRNTINQKGTVREALKEYFTVLNLAKARVLGQFFISKLHEVKEIKNDLLDNFVSFIPDLFRSIRLGTTSPHAKANLLFFNYLLEKGAIKYNENGYFSIEREKIEEAINSLANLIITIQGDGNYQAAKKLVDEKTILPKELKDAIQRINDANIPVDLTFEQGLNVIGL